MDLLLDNCLAMVGKKLTPEKVLLSKGKIAAIGEMPKNVRARTIDCGGKILLPGLIDGHVHFRCPGAEHKEDWSCGSSAAIAGGITTVIDMPNNNPSCTTQQELGKKNEIAKKSSVCNFAFHFGASNENMEELKKVEGIASFKVFMGSSTGSLLVTDEEKLKQIFSIAKERGIVVTVHAEDDRLVKENMESAKELGWNSATYHHKIRNNEVERKAIEHALRLQQEIGNKLHICHVSTREGLQLVREAKEQGRSVSCEVTPHHLFLDESATAELGNFAKMNPSLKSKEDVKALWKGVADGTVDLIATDHAPHSREEKEKGYWEAPSGVPGVETMLPLLLNAVNRDWLSLQRVVELCCRNPAKLYGLERKGEIRKGMDADLVLVDLQHSKTIKNGSLYTKCNWSPFATWELKGTIEKVFVNGEEVKLK